MTEVQIYAESAPPATPALAQALVDVFNRSAAMGVLTGPTVTRLDGAAVRRLLKDLQRHQIGGAAAVALAPLLDDAGTPLGTRDGAALVYRLEQVSEALEASATPLTTTWLAVSRSGFSSTGFPATRCAIAAPCPRCSGKLNGATTAATISRHPPGTQGRDARCRRSVERDVLQRLRDIRRAPQPAQPARRPA